MKYFLFFIDKFFEKGELVFWHNDLKKIFLMIGYLPNIRMKIS